MRVAAFYSDSTWASWTLSRGFPETIRRLGHEVLAGPIPPVHQVTKLQEEAIIRRLPTLEQLKECDAIIVNGIEHLKDWLFHVYGEDWFRLKNRKGWVHESLVRSDYRLNYPDLTRFCDEVFLPNLADAEDRGAKWLPIGVDCAMFLPKPIRPLKDFEIGFIGLLYEKRQKFLKTLQPHLGDMVVTLGNVEVKDLSGCRMKEQTELLAENYRNMEILLNLPSLSNVLVMKVLEGMACGTCVFTPHMNAEMEAKLGFEDGKHLIYYHPHHPEELAQKLRFYLDNDDQRELVARQGCDFVREGFRIERRIAEMLA